MTIDRNNYEEFLLLYIDGELSPKQTKEVELFLESNTDIQQELNDLLNAKLDADEVSFGDISTLFKSENAINKNNYQEHFLLFTDNELDQQQRLATETFVLQHPELQNEFVAIQQTKLPIETIECPDKEELYKRERKTIIFHLQKLAVAAVFIGFGVFVFKIYNINKQPNAIANAKQKTADDANQYQINKQSANPQKRVDAIVNSSRLKNDNQPAFVKKVNNRSVEIIEKKIVSDVTKNIPETLNNQQDVVVETSTQNSNTLQEENSKQIANSVAVTDLKSINANTLAINNMPTVNSTNEVVYKTLDDDDTSDATKKKSKLKSLLKKAARMITPKETSDDESKKLFAVTL